MPDQKESGPGDAGPKDNGPTLAERSSPGPAKGFELSENQCSKQLVFRFAENPGKNITDQLRQAGYEYRRANKAWTISATPANRNAALSLAVEFKGDRLETQR